MWVVFCFPRCISKELDCKWNSWDSNQCSHGMLALYIVASLAASPQLKPLPLTIDGKKTQGFLTPFLMSHTC